MNNSVRVRYSLEDIDNRGFSCFIWVWSVGDILDFFLFLLFLDVFVFSFIFMGVSLFFDVERDFMVVLTLLFFIVDLGDMFFFFNLKFLGSNLFMFVFLKVYFGGSIFLLYRVRSIVFFYIKEVYSLLRLFSIFNFSFDF